MPATSTEECHNHPHCFSWKTCNSCSIQQFLVIRIHICKQEHSNSPTLRDKPPTNPEATGKLSKRIVFSFFFKKWYFICQTSPVPIWRGKFPLIYDMPHVLQQQPVTRLQGNIISDFTGWNQTGPLLFDDTVTSATLLRSLNV